MNPPILSSPLGSPDLEARIAAAKTESERLDTRGRGLSGTDLWNALRIRSDAGDRVNALIDQRPAPPWRLALRSHGCTDRLASTSLSEYQDDTVADAVCAGLIAPCEALTVVRACAIDQFKGWTDNFGLHQYPRAGHHPYHLRAAIVDGLIRWEQLQDSNPLATVEVRQPRERLPRVDLVAMEGAA